MFQRLIYRTGVFTALGVFVLLAGGCKVSDSAVQSQANQMNTGLDPAIIKDPQVNAYFQQIGQRIQAAAAVLDQQHIGPKNHFSSDASWMFKPGNIQFHLVNSKTLNAFTTGGQHVYVYNQLFQMCQNEDQLAAVMAHEFAHIYCRHVQQGMQRQEGLTAAAVGAGVAGEYAGQKLGGGNYSQQFQQAAASLVQYVGMGFTRKDEAQADEYGQKFYAQAGWPPEHFGDFFQIMINAGYDKTPAELSDHPTLASRVAAAKKAAQEFYAQHNGADPFLKPEIANPQQFAQYKQLAAVAAQHTPDDQSLQQAQKLLNALPADLVQGPSQEQVQARNEILKMLGK